MPPNYIFIGLNAVRAFSIISLLLVFASSIFVMVTDIQAVNDFQDAKQAGNVTSDATVDCDYIEGSTVPNQAAGVFWAVVNRLLIIFQVIVLILSELNWPAAFFNRFFPVLGRDFGLGALGIFECLIGAAVLSHHVDDFSLVSAFFLFSIGCINMLLGLIFRQKAKEKRSITTWRSEKRSILPDTRDMKGDFSRRSSAYITGAPSVHSVGSGRHSPDNSEESQWQSSEKVGYGFGRQGEKAAGLKGFILNKPAESLPRYTRPRPPSVSVYSQDSRPPSMAPPVPTMPSRFQINRDAL